ncbi:MAG TPA: sulfotransferase [Saprospiraceae bacterium]|nr:sulfotransferase [Saprospiraceae bacterium]HNT22692.1 sulfotransferase [Saprospiraceae bacterium]
MNKFFPIPLFSFIKIVFQNGGITAKGLLNTPPWLLKTILFEPLRWIELVTKSKKIEKHSITKPPIFILGYCRSGTTYLQQLFMQDDRLGFTSNFQVVFPEIMLSFEKKLTPALESITRFFKIQNPVYRMPMSWYFPGEEDVAMTTSLNPGGAQWGYFFPKKMYEYYEKYVFFEYIPEAEIRAWKESYIFLLKKISLANQNKPLVLKSPPNTARIKFLLSHFPGAKFIFIHRNPYEVYASNKRLWKVINDRYTLGTTRSVDFNTIILDTYSKIMDRYLRDKDLIPQGQLAELSFEDLVYQPVESMRQIYESLDLDEYDYCENKMRSFAFLQKNHVILNHTLPLEETRMVSEKWGPFFRQWNYPLL